MFPINFHATCFNVLALTVRVVIHADDTDPRKQPNYQQTIKKEVGIEVTYCSGDATSGIWHTAEHTYSLQHYCSPSRCTLDATQRIIGGNFAALQVTVT